MRHSDTRSALWIQASVRIDRPGSPSADSPFRTRLGRHDPDTGIVAPGQTDVQTRAFAPRHDSENVYSHLAIFSISVARIGDRPAIDH
jgi:hypothetical protein